MTINALTFDTKLKVHIDNKPRFWLKGGNYVFISSKVYAFVDNPARNGYALSCLLAGLADWGKNQVKVDGKLLSLSELKKISCFIGQGRRGFFENNITVKEQIIRALNESDNMQSFDAIMDKFNLTPERVERKFSYTGNEHWRASLAIAYAGRKRIYCSPFIDEQIWDDYLRIQLEKWIRLLRDEDCVVFLPVNGVEKLGNLVDETILFK